MTSLKLTDNHARGYAVAIEAQERGPIALVVVCPPERDTMPGQAAALGVAVANERGYFPVPAGWAHYATWDEAEADADRINREVLQLSTDAAFQIIASTMGGRRYTPEAA